MAKRLNDFVRDHAQEVAVQQELTVQETLRAAAQFLLGIGITGANYSQVAQYQKFSPPGKPQQVSVHIPGIRELGDFGDYVAVSGSGRTAQDAERSFDLNLMKARREHRLMHRVYA